MAQKKGKLGKKQLTDQIIGTAPEIWLAGLAAFEQVQQEGGKFFDSLVNKGKKVEDRAKALAEGRLDEIVSKGSGAWENVEQVLESRVSLVLGQLGIPSDADFRALAENVDELEKRVAKLGKTTKSKTAKSKAAKPAKPAKPAKSAKPAAAKPVSTKAADKDDLKQIPGLGRIVEKRLNDNGIRTYRQFAQLSDEDIQTLEAVGIKIVNRARKGNWREHAKDQHLQKYNESL